MIKCTPLTLSSWEIEMYWDYQRHLLSVLLIYVCIYIYTLLYIHQMILLTNKPTGWNYTGPNTKISQKSKVKKFKNCILHLISKKNNSYNSFISLLTKSSTSLYLQRPHLKWAWNQQLCVCRIGEPLKRKIFFQIRVNLELSNILVLLNSLFWCCFYL